MHLFDLMLSRRVIGLLACLFVLIDRPAFAQVRCPLNVSEDHGITQGPIPIHGGLQGVTAYNGPAEWPFISHQGHWATGDFVGDFNIGPGMTADVQTGDTSLVLMREDLMHVHIEECAPLWGEITGPITVPFRTQIFQGSGTLFALFGDMVRDVVWDATGSTQPPNLEGDPMPMHAKVFTGHYTLDPWLGDWSAGQTNIHRPGINAWTNFESCADFHLTNGDAMNVCGMFPIFTRFDTDYEEPDFGILLATNAVVTAARDQTLGESRWGKATMQVGEKLPLLKPFSTRWNLPTLAAYSYGAVGPLLSGTVEFRKNMDLHNGNIGTLIPASGPHLDPTEFGVGPAKTAFIWQTNSGPDGIPGFARPKETVSSLLVVNVEAGAPDPTKCHDQAALNFEGPLPCVFPPPPPGAPTVAGFVTKNATDYTVTFTELSAPNWAIYADGGLVDSDARQVAPFSRTISGLDMSQPHTFWLVVANDAGQWAIATDTK